MKLLRSTLFWCVVTLCITLLVFTFLTSLCELRLKVGQREFAAFLAYESGK
ncbi:type I toxin-antitoxin system Hok family toxin [Cronobacter muytjensii]|uniref:type I toxin-antitoxin system Hok family toxin n=1 Tax=Cronobacter muytjensii TaxID=413501 RepID=UPI002A14AC1A|nr:Hok/Gef family protein [Cronobacter muytjensii]